MKSKKPFLGGGAGPLACRQAKATLSFRAWEDAGVAPTTFEVNVVAASSGLPPVIPPADLKK